LACVGIEAKASNKPAATALSARLLLATSAPLLGKLDGLRLIFEKLSAPHVTLDFRRPNDAKPQSFSLKTWGL